VLVGDGGVVGGAVGPAEDRFGDDEAEGLGLVVKELLLCEGWLQAAREHGIAVDDENGDILLATVISVITAAFWSGLTTGHYAISTRECSTPRRFLPYFERAATGSRGY
jgi:hypothetical protein